MIVNIVINSLQHKEVNGDMRRIIAKRKKTFKNKLLNYKKK